MSLVEISNVLRGGDVVFADKLDRPRCTVGDYR